MNIGLTKWHELKKLKKKTVLSHLDYKKCFDKPACSLLLCVGSLTCSYGTHTLADKNNFTHSSHVSSLRCWMWLSFRITLKILKEVSSTPLSKWGPKPYKAHTLTVSLHADVSVREKQPTLKFMTVGWFIVHWHQRAIWAKALSVAVCFRGALFLDCPHRDDLPHRKG